LSLPTTMAVFCCPFVAIVEFGGRKKLRSSRSGRRISALTSCVMSCGPCRACRRRSLTSNHDAADQQLQGARVTKWSEHSGTGKRHQMAFVELLLYCCTFVHYGVYYCLSFAQCFPCDFQSPDLGNCGFTLLEFIPLSSQNSSYLHVTFHCYSHRSPSIIRKL
jgi:hypothetical protein